MNLTGMEAETARFVEAMDAEGLAAITERQVSATDTTLADFVAKWGPAEDAIPCDNGVLIHLWNGLQVAKGKRRGDLYVVEVADGSLHHFSGEA